LIVNAGLDQIFVSGSISLGGIPSASLGTTPYSYNWLPNSGFIPGSLNSDPNPDIAPTTSAIYTLVVTDANGCSASDQVYITSIAGLISYAIPKKNIDAGFYNSLNNKIYFKFEEEYRTSVINYKILDYKVSTPGNPVNQILCTNWSGTAKNIGDNRYYIDITSCGSLSTSNLYLLEIVNDKNEKFYLKFKI
jgi:hypothetical protein